MTENGIVGPTGALNELVIGWRKCCGAHMSGWASGVAGARLRALARTGGEGNAPLAGRWYA